jgi:hypothetical protein
MDSDIMDTETAVMNTAAVIITVEHGQAHAEHELQLRPGVRLAKNKD